MEKRFSYLEVRLLFREDDIYYLKDIFQKIPILHPEVIVLFIREGGNWEKKRCIIFLCAGAAIGLFLQRTSVEYGVHSPNFFSIR